MSSSSRGIGLHRLRQGAQGLKDGTVNLLMRTRWFRALHIRYGNMERMTAEQKVQRCHLMQRRNSADSPPTVTRSARRLDISMLKEAVHEMMFFSSQCKRELPELYASERLQSKTTVLKRALMTLDLHGESPREIHCNAVIDEVHRELVHLLSVVSGIGADKPGLLSGEIERGLRRLEALESRLVASYPHLSSGTRQY